MDIQTQIERTAAALASAEAIYRKAYLNYSEAGDALQRASAERDRLQAELLLLKRRRSRVEAEAEHSTFCESY